MEIEIQVQVDNTKKLLAFLKSKAKFLGEKKQTDKYFIPKHRDFTKIWPVKEWLRLRDSSGKFSINYKNWHYDKSGRTNSCDEYETPMEDIREVEKIFKALNMKNLVTVVKVRESWQYANYEVSIDAIKGLGDFVEIEFKPKSKNQSKSKKEPKEITKGMIAFLRKFEVGKITRNYAGYPAQLLFPKEVKYEVV